MYVCMYVFMYVCMYGMYVCMYVYCVPNTDVFCMYSEGNAFNPTARTMYDDAR